MYMVTTTLMKILKFFEILKYCENFEILNFEIFILKFWNPMNILKFFWNFWNFENIFEIFEILKKKFR